MKPVLVLAACAVLLGCPTRSNPLFCDGESQCTDPDRPFCDINGAEEGIANTCVASPFAGACNDATPCSGESAPHCSPEGTCVECTASDHCTAEAPVCTETLTCGGCDAATDGDGACSARFPDSPYCLSSGGCAACRTSEHCTEATAPVCDEGGSCVGCTEHAQCDSGFCEESGSCADPETLVFVDAEAGSDSETCGGSDSPCETIAAGVARVDATRKVVVMRGGVYVEKLVLTDAEVTLVGLDGAEIQPPTEAAQYGIEVRGDSDVTIDSLLITHSAAGGNGALGCVRTGDAVPFLAVVDTTVAAGPGAGVRSDDCALLIRGSNLKSGDGTGVDIDAGSADIDQSKVFGFDEVGIDVQNSELVLTRSTLELNLSGGLRIEDSTFRVENNFIVGNGNASSGGSRFGGVLVESSDSAGPQDVRFNTVADNVAGDLDGADTTGVRVIGGDASCSSNIVWDGLGGMAHVSGNCSWTHSIVQGGTTGSNIFDVSPEFVGPTDYHITSGSPAIDAGEAIDAVTLDFDGETRPAGAGHDMGADELE